MYIESGFLQRDLRKPGVLNFLSAIEPNYRAASFRRLLDVLIERFHCSGEFPHEIGLFLGYPLHDVIGFIFNRGKNSYFADAGRYMTISIPP